MRAVVREIDDGMGRAVAERTVLRRKDDGTFESWGDVAERVALGNALLCPNPDDVTAEKAGLKHHIGKATLLMSGRHLQHGDADQPNRNQEIFTNCSTSATTFTLFMLLLNGSGVGRSYDDDMMLVNWDNSPNVRVVLDTSHPDFDWSAHESVRDAKHKYGTGKDVLWHVVEDSREGWAKALEVYENAAFEKIHRDKLLILDFTQVRCKGSLIGGMQNRPASGPVPLMNAFLKAASIKGGGLEPWLQAMYIDHYFAECVLVGGARRAARMATKFWKDKNVLGFIHVKRPIEYADLSMAEVIAYRRKINEDEGLSPNAFLWSSNNSVTVDKEFWDLLLIPQSEADDPDLWKHAHKVYKALSEASYGDGTGEPGIINVDKLVRNDDGWTGMEDGAYVGSKKYQVNDDTRLYLSRLAKRAKKKTYNMIVNPCVTGDTWIATSEGPRQVAELIDKPFTALVDGKEYPATGFWETGNKKVLKLTTDRGYTLRLTDNHKVLVETARKMKFGGGYNVTKEWIEAGDLEVGQKIVLNNHRDAVSVDRSSGDFHRGWLLGEMIGDGSYNPALYSGNVRFWGDQQLEMANLARTAIELYCAPPFRPNNKPYNADGYCTTVRSLALDELAAGLITPVEKDITPELEKQSQALVAGMLSGWFDADGTVIGNISKGRSVRLASVNVERLEAAQRMLLRLGIASTIYRDRKEAGDKLMPDGKGGSKLYQCQAFHELVITKDNMGAFASTIGFLDKDKQIKLEGLLAQNTRGEYKERFTAKVVSIELDGIEDVYDCTVDEVHRFDANGIMAHNCGEITLNLLGAYCVIADVVPFHADDLDEAEDAFRAATRALIRVNLMDCLYRRETRRTNRIGVGMTGVHEFAWEFFRVGFRDLIKPDFANYYQVADPQNSPDPQTRAAAFWMTLSRFNRAVRDEAISYSQELGVAIPHTMTTIKPAGTTSKLFGLTEGWHLPSMREFLRWVQFREDDPLIADYEQAGYPTRALQTYSGTVIVGFPTQPTICRLGMGDQLVTAAEATPEEQYQWLALGERYWLTGVDDNGEALEPDYGNQISYTLKYRPDVVGFDGFKEMMQLHQAQVRCCSVMPQEDSTAFEYQPEQPVTKAEFEGMLANVKVAVSEDVNFQHLDCASGACPIDFNAEAKA